MDKKSSEKQTVGSWRKSRRMLLLKTSFLLFLLGFLCSYLGGAGGNAAFILIGNVVMLAGTAAAFIVKK